jgi:hypothetical protein
MCFFGSHVMFMFTGRLKMSSGICRTLWDEKEHHIKMLQQAFVGEPSVE